MVHDFHTHKAMWRGLHVRLRQRMYALADGIIAVSVKTRQAVHHLLDGRNTSKVRIIENGVDLAQVPPPVFPKKITKVVLLGRIDARKGQLILTQAAQIFTRTKC